MFRVTGGNTNHYTIADLIVASDPDLQGSRRVVSGSYGAPVCRVGVGLLQEHCGATVGAASRQYWRTFLAARGEEWARITTRPRERAILSVKRSLSIAAPLQFQPGGGGGSPRNP